MKLILSFLIILIILFHLCYSFKSFTRLIKYNSGTIISNIYEINTHNRLLFEVAASSSSPSSSNSITATNPRNKRSIETKIEIEYCYKCKWMLRSSWLAQELLQTFEDKINNLEIVLKPSNDAGTFQVKVEGHLVWDRRVEGGFPEAKYLKQRVRDVIAPKLELGHSDSRNTLALGDGRIIKNRSNDSIPIEFSNNGDVYIKDDIFDETDDTTDDEYSYEEEGYDGSYDYYDVDTEDADADADADDNNSNSDTIDIVPIITPPDPIVW